VKVNIQKFRIIVLISNQIEYWSNYSIRNFEYSDSTNLQQTALNDSGTRDTRQQETTAGYKKNNNSHPWPYMRNQTYDICSADPELFQATIDAFTDLLLFSISFFSPPRFLQFVQAKNLNRLRAQSTTSLSSFFAGKHH